MTGLGTRTSQRRAISVAQWEAARELTEGAPPTRDRVAAVLGCNVSSVNVRAAAELWISADFRPRATRDAWEDFMRIARENARSDVAARHQARLAERAARDRSGQEGTAGAGTAGMVATDNGAVGADIAAALVAGPHVAGMEHDPVGAGWAENGDVVRDPIRVVARPARAQAADGDDAEDDFDGPEAADETGDTDDPQEMLARGGRFLSRRLARLMRLAERGGAISKQEIDGLTAMSRMMDRWETLAKERARHEETNRDGRIAEALRKIDRRILKLARKEAERLVAARGAEGDRGRDQ